MVCGTVWSDFFLWAHSLNKIVALLTFIYHGGKVSMPAYELNYIISSVAKYEMHPGFALSKPLTKGGVFSLLLLLIFSYGHVF